MSLVQHTAFDLIGAIEIEQRRVQSQVSGNTSRAAKFLRKLELELRQRFLYEELSPNSQYFPIDYDTAFLDPRTKELHGLTDAEFERVVQHVEAMARALQREDDLQPGTSF